MAQAQTIDFVHNTAHHAEHVTADHVTADHVTADHVNCRFRIGEVLTAYKLLGSMSRGEPVQGLKLSGGLNPSSLLRGEASSLRLHSYSSIQRAALLHSHARCVTARPGTCTYTICCSNHRLLCAVDKPDSLSSHPLHIASETFLYISTCCNILVFSRKCTSQRGNFESTSTMIRLQDPDVSC